MRYFCWIDPPFRPRFQSSSQRPSRRPQVSLSLEQLECRTVPSLLAPALVAGATPSSSAGANAQPAVVATDRSVGPATFLEVSGFPTLDFAGAAHTVTVKAVDANGNVVPSFTGSVTLASTDDAAAQAGPVSLINGVATIPFTLNTPGPQTIYASSSGLFGSEHGITVYNGNHFSVVDTTVDSNNHTVLLWDNPSGAAAVWTLDNNMQQLSAQGYAEPGWTAIKVAAGGDGLTRLLWVNNSTGAAELWLLNADDTVNKTSLNPCAVAGWTPVDVAVGTGQDSQTRLLWFNGSSGQAAMWTVDNTFTISNPVVFGPVPGWEPRALAVLTANRALVEDLPWVLWDSGEDPAALWQLNPDNTFNRGQVYHTGVQPAFRVEAEDVTVGSDGNLQVLWDNLDTLNGSGSVLYTVSSGTLAETNGGYAFPSAIHSTPEALEAGADGLTRLVWSNGNGVQEVWLINSDNSLKDTAFFGPF
ncbi:MAG: Ig-like domain-containing protein [Planctomycetes bacterium]|nr:Ig-like domain-containing protein [Planctomycetota bacterium]